MALQVTVGANTSPMQRDVFAAIDRINRSGKLKINIDDKGVTRPLGNMRRSADEFTKSLEASNSRVIAFGASVMVINSVSDAFKGLVKQTIEVEKHLANINVVMGLSNRELTKFSSGLFQVARETAQSFSVASEAATEFARQGLSVEETLKRTRDAMILTRLTGMDATSSVTNLTAAMNTFGKQVKDSTELVSKFAAVDVKFAVSAEDFAQAISRAGASAKSAGVQLDEFIGMVTAAQQQTARGGAVIGNSLKTIFTRIQKPETLRQLEAVGIAVRDVEGKTLGAKRILTDLANTFDKLTDAQKAQIAQTTAGIFQINILKAILGDAAKANGIQAEATKISSKATDQAIEKNKILSETFAASFTEAGLAVQELAKKIGDLALAPGIGKVLDTIKGAADWMSGLVGEGEEGGNVFARGFLRGVGNILTGPGLVVFAAVVGKLFMNAFKFAKDSLKSVLGITTETQKQQQIQQSLLMVLAQNKGIQDELLAKGISRSKQEQIILGVIQKQTLEAQKLSALAASLAPALSRAGVNQNLSMGGGRRTRAAGYIPNYADAATRERREATKGGYVAGAIMQGPGFVYNSRETVKKFPGMQQSAIMPPQRSKAGANYRGNFFAAHGFDPYAAGGYIPNFALAPKAGRTIGRYQKDEGVTLSRSQAQALGYKPNQLGQHFGAAKKAGLPDKKGLKDGVYDARGMYDMLVLADTDRRGTFTRKPSKSLYGVPTSQMPSIAFNWKALRSSQVEDVGKKGKAASYDKIRDKHILPVLSDVGSTWANSINMGKTSSKGYPKKLSPKDVEKGLRNDKSGASGAVASVIGALFEVAINERLGIGGGAAAQLDSEGIGGDFDARGLAGNSVVNKLFGGGVANIADYKNSTAKGNTYSMANKIAKEVMYNISHKGKSVPGTWGAKGFKGGGKLARRGDKITYAGLGYIPNFANPLGDAIGRERAAGVPVSKIRVGSHKGLLSASNPFGIGVTNTRDEPNGLNDVMGQGFVPNYAFRDKWSSGIERLMKLWSGEAKVVLSTAKAERIEKMKGMASVQKNDRARMLQMLKHNKTKLGFNSRESAEAMKQLGYSRQETVEALKQLGYEQKKAMAAAGGAFGGGGIAGRGRGMLSRMGGSGMGGLALTMIGTTAGGALQEAGMKENNPTKAGWGGALSQGAAWGGMGAMIGSAIAPGIGTAIGGVLGFAGGALMGFASASKETTEAMKKRRLEEEERLAQIAREEQERKTQVAREKGGELGMVMARLLKDKGSWGQIYPQGESMRSFNWGASMRVRSKYGGKGRGANVPKNAEQWGNLALPKNAIAIQNLVSARSGMGMGEGQFDMASLYDPTTTFAQITEDALDNSSDLKNRIARKMFEAIPDDRIVATLLAEGGTATGRLSHSMLQHVAVRGTASLQSSDTARERYRVVGPQARSQVGLTKAELFPDGYDSAKSAGKYGSARADLLIGQMMGYADARKKGRFLGRYDANDYMGEDFDNNTGLKAYVQRETWGKKEFAGWKKPPHMTQDDPAAAARASVLSDLHFQANREKQRIWSDAMKKVLSADKNKDLKFMVKDHKATKDAGGETVMKQVGVEEISEMMDDMTTKGGKEGAQEFKSFQIKLLADLRATDTEYQQGLGILRERLNIQKAMLIAEIRHKEIALTIKDQYQDLANTLSFREKLVAGALSAEQKTQIKFDKAMNGAAQAYEETEHNLRTQIKKDLFKELGKGGRLEQGLRVVLSNSKDYGDNSLIKSMRAAQNDGNALTTVEDVLGSASLEELKGLLEILKGKELSNEERAIKDLIEVKTAQLEKGLFYANRQKEVSEDQAKVEKALNGIVDTRVASQEKMLRLAKEINDEISRENSLRSAQLATRNLRAKLDNGFGFRSSHQQALFSHQQEVMGVRENIRSNTKGVLAKNANAAAQAAQAMGVSLDEATLRRVSRGEISLEQAVRKEVNARSGASARARSEFETAAVNHDWKSGGKMMIGGFGYEREDAVRHLKNLKDLEAADKVTKSQMAVMASGNYDSFGKGRQDLNSASQAIQKDITNNSKVNAELEKQLTLKLKIIEAERRHYTGQGSGSRGREDAYKGMREQLSRFEYDLNTTIVHGFRDGMVSAMEAAIYKADDLGSALRGIAVGFLQAINKALMTATANNVVQALGFNSGGKVNARVSNGEFLMNKGAVRKYGTSFMNTLNSGSLPGYAKGGQFSPREQTLRGEMFTGRYTRMPVSSQFLASNQNIQLTEDRQFAKGEYQRAIQEAHKKRVEKAQMKRALLSMALNAAFSAGMGAFTSGGGEGLGHQNVTLGTDKYKVTGSGDYTFGGKTFTQSQMKGLIQDADISGMGTNFSNPGFFQKMGMSWHRSPMRNSLFAPQEVYKGEEGYDGLKKSGRNYKWSYNEQQARGHAEGGLISGRGGVDQIPAMLTEGEYVIRGDAVRKLGLPALNAINAGKFAQGGPTSNIKDSGSPSKGGDNTNNVNITVNVENTGKEGDSKSEGDGGQVEMMQQLGKMIKEKVIVTIQEEQRPGGLLSR